MPAKKSSGKPYPPELIKAVLDAVANEGVNHQDLADLLRINHGTMRDWLNQTGTKPRRSMTDEELDAAVKTCLTKGIREMGGEVKSKFTTQDYRDLTDTQITFIDMGYDLTPPPAKEHTSEEIAAFGGVLSCVERQLKFLEQTAGKAETIQEVTATLSAAIALKQLKQIFSDPPPIDNWRDVKLITDMAREALGMNLKAKEGVARVGVDVNILGFNPSQKVEVKKGRTVDLDKDAVNMHVEG